MIKGKIAEKIAYTPNGGMCVLQVCEDMPPMCDGLIVAYRKDANGPRWDWSSNKREHGPLETDILE